MSIKKILSLNNLYLVKSSIDSKLSLTPFSQQIKQNIAEEWIKFNRRVLSLQLFVTPLLPNSEPVIRSEESHLKSLVVNYKNHYSVWCDPTSQPSGVIQKLVYFNDNNENNFLDSNENNCLVLGIFSPKQQSFQLFRKIQTIHNHWFRNLSRSPLKCHFNMVHYEQDCDDIRCSINYRDEEVDQMVEEIVYYRNSSVGEKFGLTNCDLISCNLNLDNSLLSFLFDGFTTHKSDKTRKKLKVNQTISVFKIAFLFRDINQTNDRMIEIIKCLAEGLNEFQIPVFPFFPQKPISIESCDEMGIPYTVIVDEESVNRGLLALRNRDTDIEEWVHISSFQKTVCLYLKAIDPSIVRNKAIN